MSEARLIFKKVGTSKCYAVYNQKDELICFVERIRTGRFMHYCQTIPYTLCQECADRTEGLVFSPGCQDEIRAFCKKMNGSPNLKSTDNHSHQCSGGEKLVEGDRHLSPNPSQTVETPNEVRQDLLPALDDVSVNLNNTTGDNPKTI